MKMYKTVIIILMALTTQLGYGQVTVDDNLSFTGRWVGFDANSLIPLPIENRGFDEIDISSNFRTKFAITELPVWNGLNGITRNNVQRTTMGSKGEEFPAWSMLHLWDSIGVPFNPIPASMQRPWMNVGTSYTSNIDFMYTGLLERPDPTGDLKTDAVIAWGCQDQPFAPDNFRFIFLRPQNGGAPAQQVQGLETMRITPWGNVGIGDSFSNALQPHRRTVVHERRDSAQFRIAWGVDPNPVLGQHADFQVTGNGNLHIKPRNDNANRTVAIGFLSGELGNPVNNAARLDVGGRVRVRSLQDTLPVERIHPSV